MEEPFTEFVPLLSGKRARLSCSIPPVNLGGVPCTYEAITLFRGKVVQCAIKYQMFPRKLKQCVLKTAPRMGMHLDRLTVPMFRGMDIWPSRTIASITLERHLIAQRVPHPRGTRQCYRFGRHTAKAGTLSTSDSVVFWSAKNLTKQRHVHWWCIARR